MALSLHQMDSAKVYCRLCLDHARRARDYFWQAKGLACFAACIYYQDDYEGAIQYFDSALQVLHLYRLQAKHPLPEAAAFQAFLLRNLALFHVMSGRLADGECYYKLAYKEAQANHDTNGMSIALEGLGNIHYARVNLVAALDHYQQALALMRAIEGDDTSLLSAIANVYKRQSKIDSALVYYFEVLKRAEASQNQRMAVMVLMNIGIAYASNGEHEKALVYYDKALALAERYGFKYQIARLLANRAASLSEMGHNEAAISIYERALPLYQELGDLTGELITRLNIVIIRQRQGQYRESIEEIRKLLALHEKTNARDVITRAHLSAVVALQALGRFREAATHLNKAIQLAESIGDISLLTNVYEVAHNYYKAVGLPSKALEAYERFIAYRDSMQSAENQKALVARELTYEYEKQRALDQAEHQKALLAQELKSQRQRQWLYIVGSVLAGVVVLLGIVVWFLRLTQRQKRAISAANAELAEKNRIIAQKNQNILDSIHYAKRIQETVLPSQARWQQCFPNSFVLYLPKDIVAGDFYWMEAVGNYLYLAVCDCTGHGVPGAMVSVVCSSALSRAVREEGLQNTGDILNRVREIVIQTLIVEGDKHLRDGMDALLVRFDILNPSQIEFTGANRNLWLVHQGKLLEIKGDRQPVGWFEVMRSFTTQTVELLPGSTLYFLTDGYMDQFRVGAGEKLKTKRVKEYITSLWALEPAKQRAALLSFFEEWRGVGEQIDDVTVVGVQVA